MGKSSLYQTGTQVQLIFSITQHVRDKELLKVLMSYLDCGNVYYSRNVIDLVVQKFADINLKIIPFLNQYPLQGVKLKEFENFKKVAEIMNSKSHLTLEGVEEIKKIKSGMNKTII